MKIIKNEKTELEIEVEEDIGFLNLLVDRLLREENIEVAQYTKDHPMVGNPVLYIKTKSKAPKTVLKSALKELKKEVDGAKI